VGGPSIAAAHEGQKVEFARPNSFRRLCHGPKMTLLHWLVASPLQQCTYAITSYTVIRQLSDGSNSAPKIDLCSWFRSRQEFDMAVVCNHIRMDIKEDHRK